MLREHGVLDRGLTGRLAAMARFQNLLVHVYAEVDDARVHGYLRERPVDVDRFCSAVLAMLPAEES